MSERPYGLEKTGLVRREPDAKDRRVNRVFLESRSKALIARLRKLSDRHNATILAGIDDQRLECTAITLKDIKYTLMRQLRMPAG
jgi:DNA-binding MarR family transcriptional regulator